MHFLEVPDFREEIHLLNYQKNSLYFALDGSHRRRLYYLVRCQWGWQLKNESTSCQDISNQRVQVVDWIGKTCFGITKNSLFVAAVRRKQLTGKTSMQLHERQKLEAEL